MIDPETRDGDLAFHVHQYYNRNMQLECSITPVLVMKTNPYVPSFYGETYVGVLHNNELVCVEPKKLFSSLEEAEQHKANSIALENARDERDNKYREEKLRNEGSETT